jgi:hypothetical protein
VLLHQQEHIHHENQRLEEEQMFWSKEIVVRIEYKYSPNLTIIDTPGELSLSVGGHWQQWPSNESALSWLLRCPCPDEVPGLLSVRLKTRAAAHKHTHTLAGLISAAPGKKNSALQMAARQVEAIVMQKMAQQELIIMCLEDSNDWLNATTRRTVMQVGTGASREWRVLQLWRLRRGSGY